MPGCRLALGRLLSSSALGNYMATNHKEQWCKHLCEPNGILRRPGGGRKNSISLANLVLSACADAASRCRGGAGGPQSHRSPIGPTAASPSPPPQGLLPPPLVEGGSWPPAPSSRLTAACSEGPLCRTTSKALSALAGVLAEPVGEEQGEAMPAVHTLECSQTLG